MIYRWWEELNFDSTKVIRNNILCIFRKFTIRFKAYFNNTYISPSVKLEGNITIGKNCMIGDGVKLRGNVTIGDNVSIGYLTEVKYSVIKNNVSIGGLCFISESVLEDNVYLGALVRTSNDRIDDNPQSSWNGEEYEIVNTRKLGCWIKENTKLGVGIMILPGRIVPSNSIFEPYIVIKKNYQSGHYRAKQEIEKVE